MEILQNVHSYLAYVVLVILILAVFNAVTRSGWQPYVYLAERHSN